MKKILIISNYYFPYISGMTEYIRLLANELKEKYEITVLTSNHEDLLAEEIIDEIKVVRAPIIGKISKGTISPKFLTLARRLGKEADVINLHLPMIESGIISQMIDKNKLFTTYHCDINLPSNFLNKVILRTMDISNRYCLKRSSIITTTSIDYANNSRIASYYLNKIVEIPTPIKELNKESVIKDEIKNIGFCGRIVEEKGIDVLLKAFKIVSEHNKNVRLLIGGDYKNVAGGSIYPQLKEYMKEEKIQNVEFLGKIPEEKMSEFYSSLDVFVLPSINSLEAFGMVQIEAMRCGVPVVASDLPGVRTIVQNTGMGLICKRRDEVSLARCIEAILKNPKEYIKPLEEIESLYGIKSVAQKYSNCFEEIIIKNRKEKS